MLLLPFHHPTTPAELHAKQRVYDKGKANTFQLQQKQTPKQQNTSLADLPPHEMPTTSFISVLILYSLLQKHASQNKEHLFVWMVTS